MKKIILYKFNFKDFLDFQENLGLYSEHFHEKAHCYNHDDLDLKWIFAMKQFKPLDDCLELEQFIALVGTTFELTDNQVKHLLYKEYQIPEVY
jgi:hypothetical protein